MTLPALRAAIDVMLREAEALHARIAAVQADRGRTPEARERETRDLRRQVELLVQEHLPKLRGHLDAAGHGRPGVTENMLLAVDAVMRPHVGSYDAEAVDARLHLPAERARLDAAARHALQHTPSSGIGLAIAHDLAHGDLVGGAA